MHHLSLTPSIDLSPSRLLVINIILIVHQILLILLVASPLKHIIRRLIWRHFLQSGRICRPDKVGLHVVDATLGVHQVLILFTLDLDHAHDHPIDHVDGLALVVFLPVLLSGGLLLIGQLALVVLLLLLLVTDAVVGPGVGQATTLV